MKHPSIPETSPDVTSEIHGFLALCRTVVFKGIANRRYLLALQYFYTACRLREIGLNPSEFTYEIIINYAKILEVLFRSDSTEAIRVGLAKLGYSSEEIEEDFIPVMIIRSKFNGAHPTTVIITIDESKAITDYINQCDKIFRDLLTNARDQIVSGAFVLPNNEVVQLDK